MNLTSVVQDFYTENYKTSLKEIKKYLSKRNDFPCHGLKDTILL